MNGRGIVHGQDLEGLQAALTRLDQHGYPRALERGLVAVAAQAGDVQEDIAENGPVGHDETVALGHIEPLDRTGDFFQPRIAGGARFKIHTPVSLGGSVPHPAAPFN